jgi:hypothetical protein
LLINCFGRFLPFLSKKETIWMDTFPNLSCNESFYFSEKVKKALLKMKSAEGEMPKKPIR